MLRPYVKGRANVDELGENLGTLCQCRFRCGATRFKSVGYIPIETIAPDCLDDFAASTPTNCMKNAEHRNIDILSQLTKKAADQRKGARGLGEELNQITKSACQ